MKSPKLSSKVRVSVPVLAPVRVAGILPTSSSACGTYEHYLRLPELRAVWNSRDFPEWTNEPLLKSALAALEITFRFVSTVLSDSRPYLNQREWLHWLESLAASQIQTYTIECEMRRCPYTLGLGEPNLNRKPSLEYDAVCRPNELHALKKSPYDHALSNHENQTLYATHQILESWIHAATALLGRIEDSIESKRFEEATSDCYTLEQIWNLLAEIEDLHLLMDPNDFLQLKNQLGIKTVHDSDLFCFKSKGLVSMARRSKDLKHTVPLILGKRERVACL